MKARTIVTFEGKFLSLRDLKQACQDEGLLRECAMLMKVGVAKARPGQEILSRVVGHFVGVMSGQLPRIAAGEVQSPESKVQSGGAESKAGTLLPPGGGLPVDEVKSPGAAELLAQPGTMAEERFNQLLNGPLSHPVGMMRLTRLALALRVVVTATGERGARALEEHCRERLKADNGEL